MGNRLSVTDALGAVTTWTYDVLSRVSTETDRLGKVRGFGYDAAGQLVTETNRRNQTIQRSYDAVGRPTGLNLGTDAVTWSYDLAGQLTTASNSAGTIALTYDANGRVASSAQPGAALSFVYDLAGNRIQLTDPTGSTSYHYDDRNRLTSLGDSSAGAFGFGYDAGSRLTTLTYPNGISAAYGYNAANQLLSISNLNGPANVASAAYEYDLAGNRTSETRENGITRTFAYDPNDRVTSAASSDQATVPSEGFAYDKVGNWVTDGRQHNAAHEVVEDSAYTYTYDDDGNLVEKRSRTNAADATTYTWDALNRLTHVHAGMAQVDYAYDAFGRRATRTETDLLTNVTKLTRYIYDGANVRLEISGNGTVLAANTDAGLDRMLARADFAAGATYYLHGDALNSTLALTDTGGQVVERYRYSAFGQLQVLSPSYASLTMPPRVAYTFTGRDWDPVAGLYNFRARYYSPFLGRFISQDPLGFGAGENNWFSYGGNNPLLRFDPYGLDWIDNTSNFIVGMGDSLSFGVTRAIRDNISFYNGTVDYKSKSYFAGEVTETAVEIGVTLGAAAAKKAAAKAATELGEAGLKAVRAEARETLELTTKQVNEAGETLYAHHENPLLGHPGGSEALFPTLGLESVRNLEVNLRVVTQAEHTAAHRLLRQEEALLRDWVLDPSLTWIRAFRDGAQEVLDTADPYTDPIMPPEGVKG